MVAGGWLFIFSKERRTPGSSIDAVARVTEIDAKQREDSINSVSNEACARYEYVFVFNLYTCIYIYRHTLGVHAGFSVIESTYRQQARVELGSIMDRMASVRVLALWRRAGTKPESPEAFNHQNPKPLNP